MNCRSDEGVRRWDTSSGNRPFTFQVVRVRVNGRVVVNSDRRNCKNLGIVNGGLAG